MEQRATAVGPSRIDIAYERFGAPPSDETPTVLLVMGLAAQMIHWHDGLCALIAARGFHVIRFDNRDAGHSTHFSDAPMPDFKAAMSGDVSSATYTLSDMAADAIELLDSLGIERAHVVGASMGGEIAQMMAIEHPSRVLSLTSMMATTGAKDVGQPRPEGMRVFAGGPATTREQVIERAVTGSHIIATSAYPSDDDDVRDLAGRAYDRDHDQSAVIRQAVAQIATGDRTERLRALAVPTLVIHGADDVMRDVSGGRATAAAIPNAKLVVIDGMSHSMPRALWQKLVDLIVENCRRVR